MLIFCMTINIADLNFAVADLILFRVTLSCYERDITVILSRMS